MKKKILIIAIALALLIAGFFGVKYLMIPARPEEPEIEDVPEEFYNVNQGIYGSWYADYKGLILELSVDADGSYDLIVPGGEGSQNGEWIFKNGMLYLDGENSEPLILMGEALKWDSADLFFRREKPETYVPTDLFYDAKEGDFDGYWKSHFVGVGDGVMLASAMNENTDIYIEGTNVALGGDLFGDVAMEFVCEDGALKLDLDGAEITLQIQQDGFLRLTMKAEKTVTLYCLPSAIPGEEG